MDAALILDCGATNLRACLVSPGGELVASHATPNEALPGEEDPDYRIWDIDRIDEGLMACAAKALALKPDVRVRAIAVTTFGVDGAPFAGDRQLYPIISWKCPRTRAAVERLQPQLAELYLESGVGQFPFNTLYKLIWLQERRREVFDEMEHWVFISSMLNHRLTGRLTTDRTMLGTSMLASLSTREPSETIARLTGLGRIDFPEIVEAGEVIGPLSAERRRQLGLADDVPVVSAGHDTQFAVFAASAGPGDTVLSSGTWDILMARTDRVTPSPAALERGVTTEFDAEPGLYDPGVQWLASGLLEQLIRMLYPELVERSDRYDQLMAEAARVAPGCGGLRLSGSFLPGGGSPGQFEGFTIETSRAEIYRAALEHLGRQLQRGLCTLEEVSGHRPSTITCVGGGSRNALLNRIRAEATGCTIRVQHEAESTVLGAAMFALFGAGIYSSAQQAHQTMRPTATTLRPAAPAALPLKMKQGASA